MKLVSLCFALVCAVAVADQLQSNLPPGFSSASEVASILASEPASASSFSSGSSGDSVTFRDDSAGSASAGSSFGGCSPPDPCGGAGGAGGAGLSVGLGLGASNPQAGGVDPYVRTKIVDPAEAEANAEYDMQINQVKADMAKLREALKESEECARRAAEQKAELKNLEEQKERLEKEKEKKILEAKLQKQMEDLNEITRMSRSLRTKFNELKRTQKIIRTKMTGTKTSLNQLDEMTADLEGESSEDAADNIGNEVDAMQAAQQAILARAHKVNTKDVRTTMKQARSVRDATEQVASADDLDA